MLEISVPMVLAHILCYDIWFYVTHRLMHTKQFWWIHRVHHEKREPTALDTFHGHWLESVIQDIGVFLPWPFLPTTLGSVLLAATFVGLRALLRHDARSNFLMGNHHLIHHQSFGVNFGEWWIDRVCGTHCREPEKIVRGLLSYA
jgi:Delta7-sterol 5-desaturase